MTLSNKKKKSALAANKIQKLRDIRLFIVDVDGVLTDGRIFWIESTGWARSFSVKDGYGLRLLLKAGIEVGVISGGDSKGVQERIQFLGIKHAYLGNEAKLSAYEHLKKKLKLQDFEIAYIGDELFDLPVLRKVGFAATVPQAVEEVQEDVDYITKAQGGEGAVREIADFIRKYSRHSKKIEE